MFLFIGSAFFATILLNPQNYLHLFSNRVKLVRLGHPARLLPQILDSALDAQVKPFKKIAGLTVIVILLL